MKRDRHWWVIEKYNFDTREWENVQGPYAYRSDTSVMHSFIGAVALYAIGWRGYTCRFRNKKTGKIVLAEDLLSVRMARMTMVKK